MLVIIAIFWIVNVCLVGVNSQASTKPSDTIIPNFDSPAVFQVTQPVDHAEGPVWDGRKNLLYFVDIHTGRVLSYNYDTKKVNFITLKGDVSSVIPAKKNENLLIVSVDRSLYAVEWDGERDMGNQRVNITICSRKSSKALLTTVAHQYPQSRFNDGKADKQGRLWVGTMGFENPETRFLSPNQGALYKITKDSFISPRIEVAPVNISNGLAWNHVNNKMYYIDSPSRQVIEYDFDDEKGDITNPKISIDLNQFQSVTGLPDGMTMDKDDNLWIALYGGGAVIKANPISGRLLQVVPIPARDVTSVMWGGPNLDILFVTTSRRSLNNDEKKEFNAAGSVFAVTNLKTKGVPVNYVDLVDTARRANILAEILLNTSELFAPPPSNELSTPPAANEINQHHHHQQQQQHYQQQQAASQPKPVAADKEDVPFWAAMINTIRNFF